MAGTSSSMDSENCDHEKCRPAHERANLKKCEACKDFIYAGAKTAVQCKRCSELLHDFCLKKSAKVVKFKFAGEGKQIELRLTKVARPKPQECAACNDPLRGQTRYSNNKYDVHPECAVKLVPAENDNSVAFYQHLSEAVPGVNCMICKKVNGYDWSYVMTEGTKRSGLHLHCLRAKLIFGDQGNKHKDINLEKYFQTVGTPNGGIEKFIRGLAKILTVAVSLVPAPVNAIAVQGIKSMEDKLVRKHLNY